MTHRPRRLVILDAAARVLRHYGPFKTTVRDIAREAHVGVGTVYLEFSNKDAILRALSERRHRRVLEREREVLAGAGPLRDVLSRALDARFEAFLEVKGEGLHGPDLVACACPAIEAAHRDFVSAERAVFARFLARHRIERSVLLAEVLLDAYRVFAPPVIYEVPPDELRAKLPRMHALVLFGALG